jgi:hypothetical protein
VSVRRGIIGRGRRARLVAASIALLPALAGCSSSSSIDYATDAYPNQSLVDLLKGSTDTPPPVQTPAPSRPDESDPVAAAYPSVSLIDLLTGSTKPAR